MSTSMPERSFTIGVDYGTNSVRALVVDTADGAEIGTAVWNYATGTAGVWLDPKDPHLARQHPQDYIDGFLHAVRDALLEAAGTPGFSIDRVVGIGVDTTGSTPIPVDADGLALGLRPEFASNLDALAWLWKDHTGAFEAVEITEKARAGGFPYLEKCGGVYSSEWFWSKILHCARVAPEVFAAAHSWVEMQDYIPGWLTGNQRPDRVPRGICAAGHKAMYHRDWGGLPSKAFLATLDPRVAELRDRLYSDTVAVDTAAGTLLPWIAREVGLPDGILVAVGAFDAHLGAIGSGIKPGTLVKIMGTSTCDIMVGDISTPDIPGVCGVVPGSVIPGMIGVEAGQSAVGDLFNWPASLSGQSHGDLNREAEMLAPGESGLIALDWNNGNRTILVDQLLSGLLVGQTLYTSMPEIYRAMIEATAYGTRMIIERIEEFGVPVQEIVVCGGIAEKSPLTMQIYADVCNRPFKTSRSAQTCALGSAVAASVVAGAHASFGEAVDAMTGVKDRVFAPNPAAVAVYERLFQLYRQLHDAFGRKAHPDAMYNVMKDLIAIRKEATA